jgi:hypothetical protein
MRTALPSIALLFLATCLATQVKASDVCNIGAANLVQNCGFETGDLTDWTVTGTDSGPNQLGYEYGVDQVEVYSGDYSAFFGPIGGVMDVSQTLATTAGDDYEISFALGQDTAPVAPYNNSFDVSFDGTALFATETQFPQSPYTIYTYYATAADNSALLQFAFQNDIGYFGLDSVVVEAESSVPEPASFSLMAGALLVAGIGVRAARKRCL